MQKKNEVKALKEELKWKIWEYYEILPLTNMKLFRLNRSQRNTVLAIITFMFLGIIQSLKINIDTEITFLYSSIKLRAWSFDWGTVRIRILSTSMGGR